MIGFFRSTFQFKEPKHNTGFTLIEIMVSLAIFSIVVAGIMSLSGFSMKHYVELKKRTTHLEDLTTFLVRFSDDVRGAREIMYISSHEIGIWKKDEDSDGRPSQEETASYIWDRRENGVLYLKQNYNESTILKNLEWFELAYDQAAPNTSHILLRLTMKSKTYHLSLNVRSKGLQHD